jgi:hypothetical protein
MFYLVALDLGVPNKTAWPKPWSSQRFEPLAPVWDERLFEGSWGVFWAAEEDRKKSRINPAFFELP